MKMDSMAVSEARGDTPNRVESPFMLDLGTNFTSNAGMGLFPHSRLRCTSIIMSSKTKTCPQSRGRTITCLTVSTFLVFIFCILGGPYLEACDKACDRACDSDRNLAVGHEP
jgi:hypothetical protein